MSRVVVITGGSAGIGRASARAFAAKGWDVGLLARGQERLDDAVAELVRAGVRAHAVSADVADAEAVEAAASAIESALGPIDAWVNCTMNTVVAPVQRTTAAEYARVTAVTYLGHVHGTLAALKRMVPRNRGSIVQVGSALSKRAIPLQSAYCASKHAIRGFTDSLRSELIHDGSAVTLSHVYLPAVNTPQFGWARTKMERVPQPTPPAHKPELAANAIVFAAENPRREIWVSRQALQIVSGDLVAPGLLDRILAKQGYDGQMGGEPVAADRPDNLDAPVPGHQAAAGEFRGKIRETTTEFFTSRQRDALAAGVGLLLLAGIGALGTMAADGIAARRAMRRGPRALPAVGPGLAVLAAGARRARRYLRD